MHREYNSQKIEEWEDSDFHCASLFSASRKFSFVLRRSRLHYLKEEKRERLSPRPRPRARVRTWHDDHEGFTLAHEEEDESLSASGKQLFKRNSMRNEIPPLPLARRGSARYGNVPPGDSQVETRVSCSYESTTGATTS